MTNIKNGGENVKGYLKKVFFSAATLFLFMALVTPAVSAADCATGDAGSAYQAPDLLAYEPPAAPEPEVETDTPSDPSEPMPELEKPEEGMGTEEPSPEEPIVDEDPDSSVDIISQRGNGKGKALAKGLDHYKKTK